MSLASGALRALAARARKWDFAHASRRGRQLGRLLYRFDRRHREVALANLEHAFPERDVAWRERVARDSFAQVGRTTMETLWASGLTADRVEEAVELDGFERLRERLAAGEGAILASGHLGNWELMGIAFGLLGLPCLSIARPLDDPDLDRLLNGYRTRTGGEVAHKKNALREALRALRAGKAVAILMDQNTQRHEAVFVPFFGRLAATPPAVAHLHLRTGAPVLTCLPVPSDGRYRLDVASPVESVPDDRERAVETITATLTGRIERLIRAHPGAWLWMHDRWRERPEPGEAA